MLNVTADSPETRFSPEGSLMRLRRDERLSRALRRSGCHRLEGESEREVIMPAYLCSSFDVHEGGIDGRGASGTT